MAARHLHLAILGLVSGIVLLTGFACDGGGAGDKPEPVRLTYSISLPAGHVQVKTASAWARTIEERTNGRVEITIYPAGTLTTGPQCYQGVVEGASDIGMSRFGDTPGRFPLLEGLGLPVGYPSGLAATGIATDLVRKFNPSEVAETHILYVHAQGPGIVVSKSPVRTPDDLAALDGVGATGPAARIVSALGARPMALGPTETYEAFHKGAIAAVFCPFETLTQWGSDPAVDYATDTSCIGYTTAFFVAMNKERWNSLPPDIQEVFITVSDEFVAKHGRSWDEADKKGRALAKQIITLTPEQQARWRQGVRTVLNSYLASCREKGLPGDAFLADLQQRVTRANVQTPPDAANQ